MVTREQIKNLQNIRESKIELVDTLMTDYLFQQTEDYSVTRKYIKYLKENNIEPFKNGEWSLEALDINNINNFINQLNCFNNKKIINNLHEQIKDMYPDAVSVEVFVNYYEISITPRYRTKLDGVSMKTLSGEWTKEVI